MSLVEVEGARQLRAQLRAAGDDLKDLKDLHKQAATIAAGGANAAVTRKSGRLAGSIRAAGTKTAGIIRAGYKSVPYAGPIHWGWASRGIHARPFLSTGATTTEPTWVRLYETGVDKILDQIKGKS